MKTEPERRAIIYCRVSSARQSIVGDGLGSQESRCRDFAASKGLQVDAVFTDDVSGGGDFMKRPGMVKVLEFLASHSHGAYVVIFDDLKRFARDTIFHLKLRQALSEHGAGVACLNFNFDDTPEGQFVETVLAAQGQLEREQNRRQTIQKTKARLERGYWAFNAPIGYRYVTSPGHGKVLVRDEPIASIIQEALEGYASGRFEMQTEVGRFLQEQPEYPKDKYGMVRRQRVKELLTRCIYAGLIESPTWNVKRRVAQHEGLISIETFEKIQDKLKGKAKAPVRVDYNTDFPLRGFVVCSDCNMPLTACWSSGRSARYPYYLCQTHKCASYGKSVRKEKLEAEFETLLLALKPSEQLFSVAESMFEEIWDHRLAFGEARAEELREQLQDIDKQVELLLDRIVDAKTATVMGAFEARIQKLENEKLVLTESITAIPKPLRTFDDTLRTALEFLSNPWKLWVSEHLEDRHAVLKLAFTDRLCYSRADGFRTAEITMPFQVIQSLSNGDGGQHMLKSKMVRMRGLEPPRLAALEPKSSASTNSATSARW